MKKYHEQAESVEAHLGRVPDFLPMVTGAISGIHPNKDYIQVF
jgi:hypothetical protein